jgi:hypothetical protein
MVSAGTTVSFCDSQCPLADLPEVDSGLVVQSPIALSYKAYGIARRIEQTSGNLLQVNYGVRRG